MATTAGLPIKVLYLRGQQWFDFNASGTPEAKVALAALDARGYGSAGTKAGQPPTEAQRGQALLHGFGATLSGKAQAGTVRSVEVQAEDAAEIAVRNWLRRIHAEIVGIRREETAPALQKLQTLGELNQVAGLDGSARAMLDLLAVPAVQTALAPYHIGAQDRTAGKALHDTWTAARNKAAGARGSEGTAKKDQRAAREAFEAWLNKWWAIASARLADQPQILAALGAESRKKGAAKKAVVVVAAP